MAPVQGERPRECVVFLHSGVEHSRLRNRAPPTPFLSKAFKLSSNGFGDGVFFRGPEPPHPAPPHTHHKRWGCTWYLRRRASPLTAEQVFSVVGKTLPLPKRVFQSSHWLLFLFEVLQISGDDACCRCLRLRASSGCFSLLKRYCVTLIQ